MKRSQVKIFLTNISNKINKLTFIDKKVYENIICIRVFL